MRSRAMAFGDKVRVFHQHGDGSTSTVLMDPAAAVTLAREALDAAEQAAAWRPAWMALAQLQRGVGDECAVCASFGRGACRDHQGEAS